MITTRGPKLTEKISMAIRTSRERELHLSRNPDSPLVCLLCLLQVLKNGKQLNVPLEVAVMLKITNHTNVIKLYDFGYLDKFFVLVLERPDPVEDLHSMLALGSHSIPDGLLPARAKFLFRQILMGVMHCHASGVYHSDIKPKNTLVEGFTDRAIIIDFGCAVELTSDQYSSNPCGKLDVMKTTSSLCILQLPLSSCSDLFPLSHLLSGVHFAYCAVHVFASVRACLCVYLGACGPVGLHSHLA